MNELQYVGSDERDVAIYRIIGMVRPTQNGNAVPNYRAQSSINNPMAVRPHNIR